MVSDVWACLFLCFFKLFLVSCYVKACERLKLFCGKSLLMSCLNFIFLQFCFYIQKEERVKLRCCPCQISMVKWRVLPFPRLEQKCVFGNPPCPLRVILQALFFMRILTKDMEIINDSMEAVCVSLEWLFADS